MANLNLSNTNVFFNTRDELTKVKLDRVAFFEADSNYCNIWFINGMKTTILISLVELEKVLGRQAEKGMKFIRIGKKYVVNTNYIYRINIPKQRLVLSDYVSPTVLEISVSKEALKSLKHIYIPNKKD